MIDSMIYLRLFIDSPDNLDRGMKVFEILSKQIESVANLELVNVCRYWKIDKYVEINVNIYPVNFNNSLLDIYHEILVKIGDGWKISGHDSSPDAVWNRGENRNFFEESVTWANLGIIWDHLDSSQSSSL
jgi:hypothetical protein